MPRTGPLLSMSHFEAGERCGNGSPRLRAKQTNASRRRGCNPRIQAGVTPSSSPYLRAASVTAMPGTQGHRAPSWIAVLASDCCTASSRSILGRVRPFSCSRNFSSAPSRRLKRQANQPTLGGFSLTPSTLMPALPCLSDIATAAIRHGSVIDADDDFTNRKWMHVRSSLDSRNGAIQCCTRGPLGCLRPHPLSGTTLPGWAECSSSGF